MAEITDFGISKAIDSGFSSSMLLGTIEYMAPEQFNPERYGINGEINTNLDLWSFGLMVYDLIAKESLFGGRAGSTSAEQVMSKILSDDYYEKLSKLPEPYRTVTKKCLVKNANERINSAEDVIEILTNGVHVRSEETVLIETKPKNKERSGLTSPPVVQKEVPEKTPHKSLVKPLPIIITIGAIILTVIIIASSSKSNSSQDDDNYIHYSPDTTVTTESYSATTETAPVDYEQSKDSTRK